MRRIIFLLGILSVFQLRAQTIGDLKKKADENQSNREYSAPSYKPSPSYNSPSPSYSNPSPSSGYTGSTYGNHTVVYYDDYDTDSYSSGSGGGGFLIFQLANVFVAGQAKALSKVDTIKWISSLEGGLDAGVFQNNYWIFRPHFRANWGIFSTSFRYFMSYEEVFGALDSYNTLDWQVIHLNFVNNPYVRLSAGTGFMRELYTKTSYHESTLGATVFISEWKVDATFRTASDYSTGTSVRKEISGGIHRRFWSSPHFLLYGSLSGMYATYYEEVHLWTVGLGVNGFFY